MSDFRRAQEIFADALERPAGEREAFVRDCCAADPELERDVLELLQAHEASVAWLEDPLRGRVDSHPDDDAAAQASDAWLAPGRTIGPYRLVREIGSGGMGLVYEARQDAPARRRVAIKLIKPGLDSREVTRRFEMERQTLFSLEHPHIARAYDAGVDGLGRPYFVMELVDGAPIDRYCDGHELDLEARLALFVQACRAVQYAHLRGVIHRDLKPSNVLVGGSTGEATPKVIDFGIAKALGGEEHTMLTGHAQPVGTPQAMSPEQATGQAVDIRTDVYSAGVLLYRLICGRGLFSDESPASSDWTTLKRLIVECEPPAPSVAVRRQGSAPPGVDADRIRHARELDWIVHKALAKDPGRRYQSMEEFAADIERFLRHEAVLAGPESWPYRAGKFVRRHRIAVATATVIVLLVVSSAVALGIQATRLRAALELAELDRRRAQQVTALVSSMFSAANPLNEGRTDVTARELLERGETDVRAALSGQPEVLSQLLQVIAQSHQSLGDADRAAALYAESAGLERRGGDPARLALALAGLSLVRDRQDRFEESGALASQALQTARASGDPQALVSALIAQGEALRETGRLEAGERALAEAVHLAASHPGELPVRLERQARHMQVVSWTRQGKNEQALAAARELLDDEVDAPSGALTAASLRGTIGALLVDLGRSGDALPYLEDALAEETEVLGEAHGRPMITRANIALAANNVGDLERALAMNLASLAVLERTHPAPSGHRALLLNNLGLNQHGLGDLAGAERSFREALAIQHAVVGTDHPNPAFHLSNLARVLHDTGRSAEAERAYRQALSLREKHLPADHPNRADTEVWLGALLLETGRVDEALGHLRRGVEIREAKLATDGWQVAEARSWLGAGLVAAGRVDQGLPLVVEAYPVIREQRGDHWWRTPAALDRVIAAYRAAGDQKQVDRHLDLRAQRHPEPPAPAGTR